MKKKLVVAAGMAAVFALAGCSNSASLGGGGETAESGSITVGSANFSENVLLAHIYAEALNDAGYDTTVKPNVGSREVLIPAIQDGSIDVVPEYSGALLAFLEGDPEAFSSEDVLEALQDVVPEGTELLDAAEAEDKDTLVVTAETAEKYDLTSIEDLQPVAGEMVLGGPPETKDRRAGIPGLKELYDVTFGEFKSVDLGGPLTIAGLTGGDIDVALMFTTQSAIDENGFVALEDPKYMSLAENVLPLIRADRNDDAVAEALNAVSAKLTTEDLIRMNREVEVDKKDPQKVAREYVDSI
ncbi:glycine/betaine ABC transporter substrate-binding protein [Leucobacter allii]|uniref:ABC transporter substrate-binding protein n=1 Tax=Leucobacter allii TaxID=2932247 RepID=UPI001FD1D35A|nr:ABC transporter substrate-binding protein [Leucobacter allii]UOR02174.1 glycine/betaine ABC transporter substrate-binding protein [Leucobacter allii]